MTYYLAASHQPSKSLSKSTDSSESNNIFEDENIVHHGWLWRSISGFPSHPTWKKFFYVLLYNGALCEYDDIPEELFENRHVKYALQDSSVKLGEHKCVYRIRLKWGTRCQLYLRCCSKSDGYDWFAALSYVSCRFWIQRDFQPLQYIRMPKFRGNLRNFPKTDLDPDSFVHLKVIGKGAFGCVCLSKEKKTEQYCAVKITNIIPDTPWTERDVLQELSHPFIVSLQASFETDTHQFLVTELLTGGTLSFHLSRRTYFPERHAQFYAAELVLALGYLHDQKILHRDLKLDNILLDQRGHTRLIDFGVCVSGISFGEGTSDLCGTPRYFAPETIRNEPQNFSTDWWAFGIVLYQMMCGILPFDSDVEWQLNYQIISKRVKFPLSLSVDARAIIASLLSKNPETRLGSVPHGSKDVMRHSFFKDICWEDVLQMKVLPPFSPYLASATDTSFFDSLECDQPIESLVPGSNVPVSTSVKCDGIYKISDHR